MASLEALAKSYRAKKAEVAKLRRKSQDSLKKTLSLKRRSSSGLASLERRKEILERDLAHVSQMLNQYHSQKESIARLNAATEERLKHEMDAQDSLKQQIDYGAPGEKAASQERLRFIDEKVAELHAGVKEREAAGERLGRQIADLEKQKARLGNQLRSQSHVKPALVEQLKSSEKEESVLRPKVQSLIKREEHASETLRSAERKLASIIAQKMAARRRLQQAKRKAAAKKAVKRRASKRKAAKRKPSRRAKTRTSGSKSPRKARAKTRPRRTKKVAKRRAAKRMTKRKAKTKARRR